MIVYSKSHQILFSIFRSFVLWRHCLVLYNRITFIKELQNMLLLFYYTQITPYFSSLHFPFVIQKKEQPKLVAMQLNCPYLNILIQQKIISHNYIVNRMDNSKVSNAIQLTQFPVFTQRLQVNQHRKSQEEQRTKSQGKQLQSKLQQSQPKITKKRFHQPLCIYILVVSCELFTSYSILLLAFIKDSTIPYSIYIGMTVVRCTIWFYSSYNLIGFCLPLARLYFLMDNILLLEIASIASYIGLNYKNQSEIAIASMSFYPFLLFFLAGNTRVMLVFCAWKPWQILVYKLVKFNAALFYLIYGIYVTATQQIANSQLYLLFIFSTFGFNVELLGAFNALDQSDNLIVHLSLKDDECKNLLVIRDQDKKQQAQK